MLDELDILLYSNIGDRSITYLWLKHDWNILWFHDLSTGLGLTKDLEKMGKYWQKQLQTKE